jgi:3-deoxy-7-phosphoheptulonate synthase
MTRTAHSPTATYRLFPSPDAILAEMPLPPAAVSGVARSRAEVRAVLDGTDDRLVVVTGPCSIHDPDAALEYAERLAGTGLEGDLLIVMRAYMEKPRTVTGWTGLLNDPAMDGSNDVHRGLREARRLLAGVAMLGMPTACEWLSPVAPYYLADAVTWSAIGARTTESQVHRQLVSALPMPTGFKNASDGNVLVAAEACKAAARGPTYLGMTGAGTVGVVTSHGNPDCHVVLRGGRYGPNYGPLSVGGALEVIEGAGLPRRVVIDASHGNSGKDHRRQEAAAVAVAGQVAGGERAITGVMLESFPSLAVRSPASYPVWSTARASRTPAWTSPPPRRSWRTSPPPSGRVAACPKAPGERHRHAHRLAARGAARLPSRGRRGNRRVHGDLRRARHRSNAVARPAGADPARATAAPGDGSHHRP